MINSFRYSRVGGLEVLTKQQCFPPPAPNVLVQSPVPWASLLPSPPGLLLLHPFSRPHCYHSGPASAFYCFPWGDHSPRSEGKSFWWLRGARCLFSAHTICPFLLFKKGTSELASPGQKCSTLIEKASQEMFRDIMIILCPCGDLGKQHTCCKQST